MTTPENDNIVVTEGTQNSKPVDQVVEPKAPVEPIEGETEQSEDSSEQAPKRPGRRERQLERERQENQRLRDELTKLQGQGTQKPPEPNKEPQEADFDNVIDYVKALTKFNADQGLSAYKAEQETKAQEAERAKLYEQHSTREEAFAAQNPDYAEKVAAIAPHIPQPIIDAVLRSDMSPEIAYHFTTEGGKSDLHILDGMKGDKAALQRAIAQIEDFIEANPQAAVRTTKAPPPIAPVKSKNATSSKDPADMDFEEYKAMRAQQRKARR